MGICTACNSLDPTTERPAKKSKLKRVKDNNMTSRSMVLKLDKLSNIYN
jgi:hypothetical protein